MGGLYIQVVFRVDLTVHVFSNGDDYLEKVMLKNVPWIIKKLNPTQFFFRDILCGSASQQSLFPQPLSMVWSVHGYSRPFLPQDVYQLPHGGYGTRTSVVTVCFHCQVKKVKEHVKTNAKPCIVKMRIYVSCMFLWIRVNCSMVGLWMEWHLTFPYPLWHYVRVKWESYLWFSGVVHTNYAVCPKW